MSAPTIKLSATGFQTDLDYSRGYAEQICGQDQNKIDAYLQEQEARVTALVADKRQAIEAVAADVQEWLATVNPEENEMMLYPAARALEVIGST